MKRLLLVMIIGFVVQISRAQIPTIVHDPLAFGEAVTLASTAAKQYAALSKMLVFTEENAKRLAKITSVITDVSDVLYILNMANQTYNTAGNILNGVINNKIISASSALNYTGAIIYGTDNLIRQITRLDKVISKTFEATPADRAMVVADIKKEMMNEDKKLREIQEQLNSEMRVKAMEKFMLQSQGLISK